MLTDQERYEEFKQFLQPRLFGIVAVVGNPRNESEKFPLCSGIVIETRRFLVLVTVAHYLKDVMKWEKQGRIADLGLIIHNESGLCGTVKLELDKNEVFFNEYIDIGFVVLSHDVIEGILKHGGIAVRADNVALGNKVPDSFFLLGHASTQCRVAKDIIATSEKGNAGAGTAWQLLKLSDLAFIIVSLRLDGNGKDPHTHQFTPIQSVVSDYSGTSGGPIFGYKKGSAMKDYCLFAIQSKQVLEPTREQKPKHLIATSGAFAMLAINDFIDKLKQ